MAVEQQAARDVRFKPFDLFCIWIGYIALIVAFLIGFIHPPISAFVAFGTLLLAIRNFKLSFGPNVTFVGAIDLMMIISAGFAGFLYLLLLSLNR